MTKLKDMKDVFEERARAGDGAFAIAYALMDLSESQEATAKTIQRLGNGSASTHFGAIENLAMQIGEAAQMLATALDGAANTIGHSINND
jgi:hypothetical protein